MLIGARRAPGEAPRIGVRDALDHVGHDRAEDRGELERVAAPARGDDEPRTLGVAIDPEVPVGRVAVEARAARHDRRVGQVGEHRRGELAKPLERRSIERVRAPRIARVSRPVVPDLDHAVGPRKAVPPRARDVRAPHREVRRLEWLGDARPEMDDRLGHGTQHPLEMREEHRGPRAGRDHDVVGLDPLPSPAELDATDSRAALDEPLDRSAGHELDAGDACRRGEPLDRAAARA